ncbi:MAG: DUF192 domain-containing protein [Treponema sp.]|nr:DUF192 domain-containing protein [Treponema sp.]
MKIFSRSGGKSALSFLLSFLIFLFVLASCSGLEKFDKQEFSINAKGGTIAIRAEIARTDAQREQGLMYRKEVKDGDGMLFIFDKDEPLSFWMKNTLVPLSIAYISSDGRILEIYDMEPGNLNPVQSSRSVRYALEVPQGWFGRAGIGIGDILDVSAITATQ